MFTQQLMNGITVGGIYALIALGYTMVYGILKIVNFAHGDVFMMGMFLGMFFTQALGMHYLIAFPLAAALARRGEAHCRANGCRPRFPLLTPEEVAVRDFRWPVHLAHTSFRPGRLLKSCLRRIWLSCKN